MRVSRVSRVVVAGLAFAGAVTCVGCTEVKPGPVPTQTALQRFNAAFDGSLGICQGPPAGCDQAFEQAVRGVQVPASASGARSSLLAALERAISECEALIHSTGNDVCSTRHGDAPLATDDQAVKAAIDRLRTALAASR